MSTDWQSRSELARLRLMRLEELRRRNGALSLDEIEWVLSAFADMGEAPAILQI